jgi:transposase
MTDTVTSVATESLKFVAEYYPREKPNDEVIERYRDAIGLLPPIKIARGHIIIDGVHRWSAHRREGVEMIDVIDLGDLSEVEMIRMGIELNSQHGEQLNRNEKRKSADKLYRNGLTDYDEIATVLSITAETARKYCADARRDEKEEQKTRAVDLWLNCWTQQRIADEIGVDRGTVREWCGKMESDAKIQQPPASRQDFDVWRFQHADKGDGGQSYFGALPPQVVENLLWFFTEPNSTVVDLFAGSGTVIDVAKRMFRRIWASDIRGDFYAPHLPIHKHNALHGWPDDAPKSADLIVLDPPYWQQAKGRYSNEDGELAEMNLSMVYGSWSSIVNTCADHISKDGRLAFIISPTQKEDGTVVDHAMDMASICANFGLVTERRIIVPYSTQQATGQQVTWARENRRMLKLYRDLVVMKKS